MAKASEAELWVETFKIFVSKSYNVPEAGKAADLAVTTFRQSATVNPPELPKAAKPA